MSTTAFLVKSCSALLLTPSYHNLLGGGGGGGWVGGWVGVCTLGMSGCGRW